MGREYRGEERREETVDLPVAMEPVRPMISILRWFICCRRVLDGCLVGGVRGSGERSLLASDRGRIERGVQRLRWREGEIRVSIDQDRVSRYM